jgi:hypothetical protein
MDYFVFVDMLFNHFCLCALAGHAKLGKKQIKAIFKVYFDIDNSCSARVADDINSICQQFYIVSSKEKNICQLAQKNSIRR